MFRKSLAVVVCALAVASIASAESLEEVLAKNYEARGGLDALHAVNTAKLSGTMTVGPGVEAPFTWYWERPNKIRMEFTVQGQTGIQAYNGEIGWMFMPFMGKAEPEKMPDEAVKQLDQQADFEGPLVDWEKKGHTVELMGKENVEGTDAYKLKVTLKGGDVSYVYLDAEYYLEIKEESKRTMRGQEVELESTSGDYKEVGDLLLPHSMTSKAKGAPAGQTITITSIELNPELADDLFDMPAAAPAAESSN